ncbi:MAG: RluA family pseudouridine synthase [Bdellovibrionales bacterium]|nr:RluA family pseudouridine synthase [Bdellovibrionales bacterium]
MDPRILFEDTHLVVVSKPAGLLSQGEKTGDPNLVDWCRAHFGRNYVGLVHRLDRFTSGLMVVAKRSKSAERLTNALRDGELVRVYHAILEGRLAAAADWRHHLRKDPATNTTSVVRAGAAGAKEASLHVRPIESKSVRGVALTLAEFRLETGRSHQIRVQSAAMGHPLLGDTKYGARQGELGLSRPALHSAHLEFPHPMTKETLRFDDPLPADLAAILDG